MKKMYKQPQTDLLVLEASAVMQLPLVVSYGPGGTAPGSNINGDE